MVRKMKYREGYLQSPEWKTLREAKKKKTPQRCAVCAETSGLIDCHHLLYRDLVSVTVKDLLWLCRRCHDVTEDLKRRGKIDRDGEPVVLRAHTIELVKYALGDTWWERPKGDTDGSAERKDPGRRRCMATTKAGKPCPTMAYDVSEGGAWLCHIHLPTGRFRQQQAVPRPRKP